MIIVSNVKIALSDNEETAIKKAFKQLKIDKSSLIDATVHKVSVDARKKNKINIVYSIAFTLNVDEKQLCEKLANSQIQFKEEASLNIPVITKKPEHRPIVIGFGPAGMFCALLLSQAGLKPIVFERGDCVEQRVKKVDTFWHTGILDCESNVQFGEGGAGTFSDGKLTTRISDHRCAYILKELVRFGADNEILKKNKPHIGTDKLRDIVKNIRCNIIENGGEVFFNHKLEKLSLSKSGKITSITVNGEQYLTDNLVVAIGHSARDTFQMLNHNGIYMENKPFSVGVRIEHLQSEINKSLYGKFADHPLIPTGEYQLSFRNNQRAVYTFCMCPGGLVVPSSSEEYGVVTNGMSEYSRDRQNANSALVVSVDEKDFGNNLFSGMEFQRALERKAFDLAGGSYKAPAQTCGNFLENKSGLTLGKVEPSYSIGLKECDFNNFFPEYISSMMKYGLENFNAKIKGFSVSDAVMTGVETRTSSPVRITRDEGFNCIGKEGIYPCGEGAGYAGGIVSAAVDGVRVAMAILDKIS